MDNFLKKVKAVVIGHAVADALGVPVEFRSREELDENPVTDMREYGTYNMPKGTWSDDTSMSLCALDSISKGEIDLQDIMNNFCKWYYNYDYTADGIAFDVGNACSAAIVNYYVKELPLERCGLKGERDNGNGSLMRIHPFALFLYGKAMTEEEKIEVIHKASALTHAHDRSKIACGIYAFVLWELLADAKKESISVGLKKAKVFYGEHPESKYFDRAFGFANIQAAQATLRAEIKSSGYVVDSLEAALWCLLTTETYEECVIKAVNLGSDTDTVAAIAGGLAGGLYGFDAIPRKWLNDLINEAYIEGLCEKAFKI